MTAKEFMNLVMKFADRPEDVVLGNRTLIAEVHQQTVEVCVTLKDGIVYCIEEDGNEILAERWVVRHLGNIDLLANRILEFIPKDTSVIPARAQVTHMEESDNEITEIEDIVDYMPKMIENAPPLTTNIIYVTSAAGEGKTYCINTLAREQAQKYLKRKSNWIVLPISMHGKQMMRLDGVVIASLANDMHFRYLPFEALLELVKRKVIVLALDGFEEMFIESQTGEVASSMSNLVARLDSQGTLIFAAREAYYRYSNLETQAKLQRSIRDMNVAFGEAKLKRWNSHQFILCCEKKGLNSEEALRVYRTLEASLSENHPIITRAVLARKAIDEIAEAGEVEEFGRVLGKNGESNPEIVFERFVKALLVREATEKWLDRAGDAASPLLSTEEHIVLLTNIAEEMWLGQTEFLTGEIVETLTEAYAEQLGKNPTVLRQAKLRIRQHALLKKAEQSDLYSFDHEEFHSYFLGKAIAQCLITSSHRSLRKLFGTQIVPDLALRVALCTVSLKDSVLIELVEVLNSISSFGSKSSYVRINCAAMLVRILSGRGLATNQVANAYIPKTALKGVEINGIAFKGCIIDEIDNSKRMIRDTMFSECSIQELICQNEMRNVNVQMDVASIPEVVRQSDTEDVEALYSPGAKMEYLREHGYTIQVPTEENTKIAVGAVDGRIADIEKLVRIFRKTTQVNESVLSLRYGKKWSEFERDCLEDVIKSGILVMVPYTGHGRMRRFRLGVGFDDVDRARKMAHGNYSTFLHELKSNSR